MVMLFWKASAARGQTIMLPVLQEICVPLPLSNQHGTRHKAPLTLRGSFSQVRLPMLVGGRVSVFLYIHSKCMCLFLNELCRYC